jgi:hypothetical protein
MAERNQDCDICKCVPCACPLMFVRNAVLQRKARQAATQRAIDEYNKRKDNLRNERQAAIALKRS